MRRRPDHRLRGRCRRLDGLMRLQPDEGEEEGEECCGYLSDCFEHASSLYHAWYDRRMDVLHYALIALSALVFAYFLGIFTGAHYVPTSDARMERMLRLARLSAGDRFVDIGSGDGKLVIAAAQMGADAYGYELNPVMVLVSKANIQKAGLSGKAHIYWKDFWHEDLSSFDVVTVYGIPHIMGMLEKKLQRELREGGRVASNAFPFPSWKEEAREGGVFVYVKT
jgi:cyclopropane fatty-acyl-phospholipid synthase-like methyltransferase